MKMKFPGLLMAFIMMCGLHAIAQQALKVKGSVFDNYGKPLHLVTISLISAHDSTLVKTDMSDEQGEFEIISRSPGFFILGYTSIGFEPFYSPAFEILPV